MIMQEGGKVFLLLAFSDPPRPPLQAIRHTEVATVRTAKAKNQRHIIVCLSIFCDISYHIPLVPLGGCPWWVILVWWAGRQTDFRCGCDNSRRGCLRGKGLCIGRLCGQVGCIDHARREWIFANNELVIMEYHKLYPSRLLHHTPPRCRLCQIAIIQ